MYAESSGSLELSDPIERRGREDIQGEPRLHVVPVVAARGTEFMTEWDISVTTINAQTHATRWNFLCVEPRAGCVR